MYHIKSIISLTLLACFFSPLLLGQKELKANDTLVFFGDSITQLGARPNGYVDLVSKTIKRTYPKQAIKVIGAGVGGNKVPDLERRLERDVLGKKPNVVLIYIGINDVWHWTKPHPVTKAKRQGTTAEVYEAGLRSIIDQIKAIDARVILCTPTVINEQVNPQDPNYVLLEKYAQICRDIARDTDSQLLDLRKEFIAYLKKHNTKDLARGVLTQDTVHMNDEGNFFLAKLMLKALRVPDAELSKITKVDSAKNKENLHLYLLIGQSNMAGRAAIPADAKGDIKNSLLLNQEDEWEAASNPLNKYSSIRKDLKMQKLNPGYSFAQKIVKHSSGAEIGLIVNARGGTKIENWARGQKCYEEAIRRCKIAQKSGTLKGIVWHQGESNYTDAAYLPKLIELVNNLREDLGNKELPFVAGQINKIDLINNQIAALPENVAYTSFISSEDLVTQDKWHYNTASQLKMGERYADEILALQKLPSGIVKQLKIEPINKAQSASVENKQSQSLECELIDDVEFYSSNEYKVMPNALKNRVKTWTDRTHTYKEIPEELIGATYIQTPVMDRGNKNEVIITFTMKKAASVYVNVQAGRKLPKWLNDWEETSLTVKAAVKFTTYKKKFKAADVVILGSTRAVGATSMYTVIIKE